jgi:hypothetical protein
LLAAGFFGLFVAGSRLLSLNQYLFRIVAAGFSSGRHGRLFRSFF